MKFDGKVVLVTGASSGIGEALITRLAKENCKLVLIARRIELLQQLSGKLNLTEDRHLIIKCDVGNKEDVARAYELLRIKFGGVDVAILNAGYGHKVTVDTYDSQYAEKTFGANFFGIVYWVEQLLPQFADKGTGIIAAVSSLADNRGYSGSGFYCASKAAASTYLEGLRIELKPRGVKVITIKPGFVRTPMTDSNDFKMPLLMEPEKAARIITEGIKKEKSVIQFPWQTVFLTRLVGMLPNSLYEWLAGKSKYK